MKILNDLLGLEETAFTLSVWQMALRSVIVFFITIGYVRFSGMRTFGSKTAFDTVIYIILGAILSRAIVAASPFFSTLLAGFILVALHRILARFSFFNEKFGNLVKGEQRLLVKNGEIIWANLKRSNISKEDLLGGLRKRGIGELSQVKEAHIERNGEISVLPTEKSD